VRCADIFGVAEAETRCAGGEFEDAEGAMSTYDGLSWGAGDGAIAMAVLMMLEGGRKVSFGVARLGYTFMVWRLPAAAPNSCALLNSSRYRIGAFCVLLISYSYLTRDLVPPNQNELLLAAEYCCFSWTGKVMVKSKEVGAE
jgi:hypothetical protein